MLGSLLSTLTVSALVLLVPASVGLLTMGRHAHVAVVDASTRRVRLVMAATLIGLGALGVSALMGVGPFPALLVGSLLAGSVLAWSRRLRTWEIRGIVAWAMSSTGVVALVGWIAERIATTSVTVVDRVVGGAAWLVLLFAVVRLGSFARGRLAGLAVRGEASDEQPERAGLPVPATLALVASAGVVAAVAGGPWPGHAPSPVAGTSSGASDGTSRSGPPSPEATMVATRSASGAAGSPTATATSGAAGGAGPTGVTGEPGDPTTTTSATPTDVQGPTVSSAPESSQGTKTPGYAKDNPNRPSHASTPGPGSTKQP
ncbi:MAG: hypothetical protein ACRDOW_08780 [Nocardioidaceae bacterium]